jgi:hypothetical protein
MIRNPKGAYQSIGRNERDEIRGQTRSDGGRGRDGKEERKRGWRGEREGKNRGE